MTESMITRTAKSLTEGKTTLTEKMEAIFYFVRDEILFDMAPDQFMSAEMVLEKKRGSCMNKALLLKEMAQAADIPARLHFMEVSKKALEDLLHPAAYKLWPETFLHTYPEVRLQEIWVSMEATFDIGLHEALLKKKLNFARREDLRDISIDFDITGVKGAQQYTEIEGQTPIYDDSLAPLRQCLDKLPSWTIEVIPFLFNLSSKWIREQVRDLSASAREEIAPTSDNLKKLQDLFDMKNEAVFSTISPDNEPNIVPVHSKHLIPGGKIMITDQFMNKTRENVLKSNRGTLCIQRGTCLYRFTGECHYKDEGDLYLRAVEAVREYAKKKAKNRNIEISCKGIILMDIQKVEKLESLNEGKLSDLPPYPERDDLREICRFSENCKNCLCAAVDSRGNLDVFPVKRRSFSPDSFTLDVEDSDRPLLQSARTVAVTAWERIYGYQFKGIRLTPNVDESISASSSQHKKTYSKQVKFKLKDLYHVTPGKLAGTEITSQTYKQ